MGAVGVLASLDLCTIQWLFINYVVSAVDPGNLKEPVYSSEENIMETFTKYLPTKYLSETFTSYLSQCKNKGSQEKKIGIFVFFFPWLEILVYTVQEIGKDLNCSHADSFLPIPGIHLAYADLEMVLLTLWAAMNQK